MSMKGLSKAFYVWAQPIKGAKGVEKIHTRDGRDMTKTEWEHITFEAISKAGRIGLLRQIEEYVENNLPFVKRNEVRHYSMNCLLKESYKEWNDFHYQENLTL